MRVRKWKVKAEYQSSSLVFYTGQVVGVNYFGPCFKSRVETYSCKRRKCDSKPPMEMSKNTTGLSGCLLRLGKCIPRCISKTPSKLPLWSVL